MKKPAAILLCLVLVFAAFAALAESPLAESPPAEGSPFTTAGDAVTDQSMVYSSADYYVILTEENGDWWRADVQTDDRYREMYSTIMDAENIGAAYDEMIAYVHTLPLASAEKLGEQPLSKDTLNSYAGKKMKDLLADGFGFDWSEGFTGDESKAGGSAEILRPADAGGTVYRIPLYLVYTDPECTDGILFYMNRGIYSYQFSFGGTEETLKEAIENRTWEEMEITGPGLFTGFSSETVQNLGGDPNARLFLTREEAGAIRTVRDAQKYDSIGFYTDNGDEYRILINGMDCFWLATAKLDDRYRALARAAYGGNDGASDELWDYEASLPVTVEALENEHPPIPDLSAYAGKNIRELQAEGFRIYWFYATTADPAKEEYNKTLRMPDADGKETYVNGYFSYNDYNEYCTIDMELGMYQYTFSFEGTAETLEAALRDGTFPELTVREAAYSGMSSEATTALMLR